ncbi:MAG: four helix bundle protein [Cyclobacteriaceae bacterium]
MLIEFKMAFQFENLRVWQRSLDLTLTTHKLTKTFPSEEKFNLSSQIQRATDSINLNIAEGSTGQTKKEFSRFLSIALRSAIEVVACLQIGKSFQIMILILFIMN